MNERIQDLAILCATQLDWDFPSDPKGYTFSSIALEKFAELIVRECAKVGERYADGNYEVFNQILEHFGLEEE